MASHPRTWFVIDIFASNAIFIIRKMFIFSVLCKDQFVEMKNDKSEEELFVTCCKCGKRFHQICVLYVEQIQKNR